MTPRTSSRLRSARKRGPNGPEIGRDWGNLPVTGVVFGLALVLRCIHVWQIESSPLSQVVMGDSRAYDSWARTIAAGDWIGREVFYQAPLYPYFMGVVFAVAGADLFVLRLCQALVGSLGCAFIAAAAMRLFSSSRGSLAAGLMLALYPPAIFFDGLIQKTTLDAFLIAVAIWLLTGLVANRSDSASPGSSRPGRWLALGLTMGVLGLTRENALLLVAVIAAWACLRRGLVPVGAFAVGLALVLLPVAARNFAVGGGFYLTTSQFGTNFYLGNNARTDGTAGSLLGGRGDPEFERRDATEIAERESGRRLTPGEVSSYWTGRALSFIRAEPAAWLRLMARKVALLWNTSEAFDTESQESYAEWSAPLRVLGVWHFGVLAPLGLFGAWITWADRRLRIFALLAVTYAASVVLFFIYARYRYPLVPFLVLFTSAGLVRLPHVLDRHSRTRLVIACAATLLFAVAINRPMLAAQSARAVTEHNLGAAMQSAGQLDAAIAHYHSAIESQPDYVPALSNLGSALRAKGDTDGALAAYQRALVIAPEFPDAHYNLGNLLLGQDRAEEAIPHFEAALRADPGVANIHTNLAIALAGSGRLPDAEMHLRRAGELAPDDGRPDYELGRLLVARGEMAAAVDAFRASIAKKPGSAETLNDLGLALAGAGRLEEAIEAFDQALKVSPDFREARENLAAARTERGQR